MVNETDFLGQHQQSWIPSNLQQLLPVILSTVKLRIHVSSAELLTYYSYKRIGAFFHGSLWAIKNPFWAVKSVTSRLQSWKAVKSSHEANTPPQIWRWQEFYFTQAWCEVVVLCVNVCHCVLMFLLLVGLESCFTSYCGNLVKWVPVDVLPQLTTFSSVFKSEAKPLINSPFV